MPRPAGGYRNAAGQAIPGTHDPISRYMDQTALKIWAYNQGKKGLPLWGRADLDIGHCVHKLGELDLKGRPDREIEAEAHQWFSATEHLQKVFNCFRSFRNWRDQCKVRAVAMETPLVSEVHQYGGTPDWVLMFGSMNGALGLVDCKSSAKGKAFPDMRVALAAHANLWAENYPDKPLRAGHHLLMLPKDGGDANHLPYSDLTLEWEIFKRYLECYRLEKEGLAFLGHDVPPKRAPRNQPIPREKITPRIEPSPRFTTMAEILRGYGHVKEGVPA